MSLRNYKQLGIHLIRNFERVENRNEDDNVKENKSINEAEQELMLIKRMQPTVLKG